MTGAINWMLLHAADLVVAVWHGVGRALSWLGGVLHDALNPVLSPVLSWINPACNRAGEAVFAILSPLPPWAGLVVLAVLTGVGMLSVFRWLSNQRGIARARDEIKANLLALKLYKDELRVTFLAQWRLFKALVRLQRYLLTPALCLFPFLALLLAQMGLRYQWRPFRPGESFVVTLTWADDSQGRERRRDGASDPVAVRIESPPALPVEIDGIPGGGKVTWRLRAEEAGRHRLTFHVGDETFTKAVVVSERFARVCPRRVAPDWVEQLLYPAEPVLPRETGVISVEVAYPPAPSRFHGAGWWAVWYFVLSMATAFLLRPIFNVRF